jgi:hypothetical protein
MPSIRDFSGGVMNPELQNRDSGNGVLYSCKNVLSSPNGELRKRTGTRFIKKLPYACRIIPFTISETTENVLLVSNNKVEGLEWVGDYLQDWYTLTGDAQQAIVFPMYGWTSNVQGKWTVSSSFEPARHPKYTNLSNEAYKAIKVI